MKVELLAQAEADLRTIARWIALENPHRAQSFAAELRLKCVTLARSPLGFALIRTTRNYEIRKQAHGRYLIFYVTQEDRIAVLRIVHGARDWASMFDESE